MRGSPRGVSGSRPYAFAADITARRRMDLVRIRPVRATYGKFAELERTTGYDRLNLQSSEDMSKVRKTEIGTHDSLVCA